MVGQTEDHVRYRCGSPCETMKPPPPTKLSICSSKLHLMDQIQACVMAISSRGRTPIFPMMALNGPDAESIPPSLVISIGRKTPNEIKSDYILSTV